VDEQETPPGTLTDGDWSGPRPLVRGAPVVVGAIVAALALGALIVALTRDPGRPSRIAAHYVAMMAGALSPRFETADPVELSAALARSDLGFTPSVASLEPEFTLLGGDVHELDGRPIAAWFYRDSRADMVLVEAFAGTLRDLGEPEDVRTERQPALHIFRKTTQTLAFWEGGDVVYVLVTTLPGERAVTLARRLTTPSSAR
jgi:hypothetical protein